MKIITHITVFILDQTKKLYIKKTKKHIHDNKLWCKSIEDHNPPELESYTKNWTRLI